MASPHHVDSVTPTHTNTPQYKYNVIILQIQTQKSTNINTITQIQYPQLPSYIGINQNKLIRIFVFGHNFWQKEM